MSMHISAKPGEIAKKILLPGDPLRAKYVAEKTVESYRYMKRIMMSSRISSRLSDKTPLDPSPLLAYVKGKAIEAGDWTIHDPQQPQ